MRFTNPTGALFWIWREITTLSSDPCLSLFSPVKSLSLSIENFIRVLTQKNDNIFFWRCVVVFLSQNAKSKYWKMTLGFWVGNNMLKMILCSSAQTCVLLLGVIIYLFVSRTFWFDTSRRWLLRLHHYRNSCTYGSWLWRVDLSRS